MVFSIEGGGVVVGVVRGEYFGEWFWVEALRSGIANEELYAAARAWREWRASENAWFLVWHGELLCRV